MLYLIVNYVQTENYTKINNVEIIKSMKKISDENTTWP